MSHLVASMSNTSILCILAAISAVNALSSDGPARLTQIFFDSSNHLHRDIQYHPEQPQRIERCVKALQEYCTKIEKQRIKLVDVAESSPPNDIRTEHAPFSMEELDHARAMLVEAHSEVYVSNIENRCRSSRQCRVKEGKNPLGFVGYVDDDTYLTTESFDVCLRATAAWIRAVDCAMNDDDNKCSMALTRPPGHHATKNLSNGFCLFNFAAAAALHALQRYPSMKLSIFDWDVHYGQGVANIIESQPRARYVSIHQTPAFPYQGESCEVRGDHQNILTIPILADTTWTCGYKQAFFDLALPFIKGRGWHPDLVMVCAGYDALSSDELASVSLVAKDYARMTEELLDRLGSEHFKRPGLMLGLEGGYQLASGAAGGNLADAVVDTVRTLVEAE
jgi:acetoin utilization deacetylase AcuC-like enzyme